MPDKVESKAEVFLWALRSLPKTEKEAVISRLLEDPEIREDILDIALIELRKDEPSRPFRDYLRDRVEKTERAAPLVGAGGRLPIHPPNQWG